MPNPPSVLRARRARRAGLAAGLTAVVALAVLQTPAQADSHQAATLAATQAPTLADQQGRRAGPASAVKVTLVTGDVVTVRTLVDGSQMADVDRPDGAVGSFRMQKVGGDLFIVPDEAVPLLGADLLDPRLFDVTDLIEMGYDDASVDQVPTIVTYAPTGTRPRRPARRAGRESAGPRGCPPSTVRPSKRTRRRCARSGSRSLPRWT